MKPRFKVGQVVVRKDGESFELGVVKEAMKRVVRQRLRQDGLFGEATGPERIENCYLVQYRTGDSVALIEHEHNLHKLENDCEFIVSWRKGKEEVRCG